MKEIDLSQYSLEDLVLTAIRSEIDSYQLYFKLSKTVQNAFLRERLDFLAAEETKHKEHLRTMYKELFPEKKLKVPDEQVVPLPRVKIKEDLMPLSEVLGMAMEAEVIAAQFYRQVSTLFQNDKNRKALLLYFASMEDGHYKLLEAEKENLLRLEEYGQEQEMIHLGP